MEHTLLVEGLAHNFGKRIIFSNVNFEFKTGEIIGILGRNGSGKSTLFNMLFGSLKASKGDIYFDNKLFQHSTQLNRSVGYHTQGIMLPKGLKTKDLITISVACEKQDNIYYSLGIHEILNVRIENLSIGQQRYLQFLLLLNMNHPFIILDEPFSMVDPLYVTIIKEMIIKYKELKCFIISDHYYLDVLNIASKICLINNGEFIHVSDISKLSDLGYLSENAIKY